MNEKNDILADKTQTELYHRITSTMPQSFQTLVLPQGRKTAERFESGSDST